MLRACHTLVEIWVVRTSFLCVCQLAVSSTTINTDPCDTLPHFLLAYILAKYTLHFWLTPFLLYFLWQLFKAVNMNTSPNSEVSGTLRLVESNAWSVPGEDTKLEASGS